MAENLYSEKILESMLNLPRKEYMKNRVACKIYLKRTLLLSKYLGNPHKTFKYIHVAGTSGKGSVVRMIGSILGEAGIKYGTYTSPHILKFNDRFTMNGRTPGGAEIQIEIKLIKAALEKFISREKIDTPSYFEIDFLLALLLFKRAKIKLAVIEAGCGGTYDATNIIPPPLAAIITNIGLDHTDILGSTKEKIAKEKAGIIKKGSVFLSAEKNPRIKKILAKAAKSAGASDIFFIAPQNQYAVSAFGDHQKLNAALAAAAVRAIPKNHAVQKKILITENHIISGLKKARIPAAFEIIKRKNMPAIIIDGAHNSDKINTTKEALIAFKIQNMPKTRVFLIFGMAHNKNFKNALSKLLPHVYCVFPTRFANNIFRKCRNPMDIELAAKKLKPRIKSKSFLFPEDAFEAALKAATKNDIILVTGSIFLAGELRKKALKI